MKNIKWRISLHYLKEKEAYERGSKWANIFVNDLKEEIKKNQMDYCKDNTGIRKYVRKFDEYSNEHYRTIASSIKEKLIAMTNLLTKTEDLKCKIAYSPFKKQHFKKKYYNLHGISLEQNRKINSTKNQYYKTKGNCSNKYKMIGTKYNLNKKFQKKLTYIHNNSSMLDTPSSAYNYEKLDMNQTFNTKNFNSRPKSVSINNNDFKSENTCHDGTIFKSRSIIQRTYTIFHKHYRSMRKKNNFQINYKSSSNRKTMSPSINIDRFKYI